MAGEADSRYPRDRYCVEAAHVGPQFYLQPLQNGLKEMHWADTQASTSPFGIFATNLNANVNFSAFNELEWLAGGAEGLLRVAFSIGQPTIWQEVNDHISPALVEETNSTFSANETGRRASLAMNMHSAEREFFSSSTAVLLLFAAYGAKTERHFTDKGRAHIVGKLIRPLKELFPEPANDEDDFMARIAELFSVNAATNRTHASDIIHESRAFVNSTRERIAVANVPGTEMFISATQRHATSMPTTAHPGVCPGQDASDVIYQAMGKLLAHDEGYRSLVMRYVKG